MQLRRIERRMDSVDMDRIRRLAQRTGTEIYGVFIVLAPKRLDGELWLDAETKEVID